ncbi:MAG TPA: NUDIX hydrolase [Tepidisphaeraceae bacterium]|jgi:8-oxo-dGTP pyrophosphatase MutT (NUDIX family)
MATAPDWYYKKPFNVKHRTGAGGVVARREGDRILIALIRDRGDHEYVLPKGGVEYGESLEEAAAREIHEEAGFRKLKLLGELGTGERLGGKKSVWQKTHYFLFLTRETEGKPTDRRDWEVHWHELDKLPALYWQEQERLIQTNRERIIDLIRRAQ